MVIKIITDNGREINLEITSDKNVFDLRPWHIIGAIEKEVNLYQGTTIKTMKPIE